MCLLQCLNGHIRVIYPTSHQSVSSWPPALPRSAPDAHWPPLEARYLRYIRITSTAVIHPLTCEKEEGRRACHALVLPLVECAPHVAAAECTTALSHAPSRRPPTPITAAPSEDPKMPSRHRLFSPPLTPSPGVSPQWETSHCAHQLVLGVRLVPADFDHCPLRGPQERVGLQKEASRCNPAVFSARLKR